MDKDFKILIIILVIVAVLTFSIYKGMPILSAQQAFQKALNDYDQGIVENAEKIFRLETNNFLSGQFTGSYSPGMEPAAGVTDYPYGWTSLQPFWDANPDYTPTGLDNFTENGTGIYKPYICFPTVEAAIYTVCEKLRLNGNDPGAWFSTDPTLKANYVAKLNNITPYFSET